MNITSTIPSYAYWEYQDDSDITAWFQAYNGFSQSNLDAINAYELPVYFVQSGALLSWAGASIYGIARPDLSSGGPRALGPIDTAPFNTLPFNAFSIVNDSKNFVADDLTYQRILQWNTFKGDGFDFTIRWLKRRVERFLRGETFPDQTYEVSVSFTGPHSVLISIQTTNLNQVGGALFAGSLFAQGLGMAETITQSSGQVPAELAQAFQAAINSGVLLLPFQYTFTVQI